MSRNFALILSSSSCLPALADIPTPIHDYPHQIPDKRPAPACTQRYAIFAIMEPDSRLADARTAFAGLLVEKDEEIRACLGKGTPSQLALQGDTGDEYVILTDRRIYYRGAYLTGPRPGQPARGPVVIPLVEVSSFRFSNVFMQSRYGCLVMFVTFLFLCLAGALLGRYVGPIIREAEFDMALKLWGGVILLDLVICAAIFRVLRHDCLCVSSPPATMNIGYKLFGKAAVKDLAKLLRASATTNKPRLG